MFFLVCHLEKRGETGKTAGELWPSASCIDWLYPDSPEFVGVKTAGYFSCLNIFLQKRNAITPSDLSD